MPVFLVTDLPPEVCNLLSAVGYCRKDISVSAAETYSLADMGSDGCRAFTGVVNLATGEKKVVRGSWGGPNMFCPRNPIDCDDTSRPILPNMVVMQGSEGGGRPVYATLTVHPTTIAPMLPAPTDVTLQEALALGYIKGYKPSYRAERFRAEKLGEYAPTAPLIRGLATKGLITINKAGAIQITVAGKNVARRVS